MRVSTMQFNTIYINNISKEINQHTVDAISTNCYDTLNAGTMSYVDESLHSLGINNPYFIFNGPCEWFGSWSDSRINFEAHTEVYFFLYEVLSVWHNHSRYNCPDGSIKKECKINEFEMIQNWCNKHNVSKFSIFTNEYRMLEQLQNTKYTNWAIYPLDTFSLGYCKLNREPSNNIPEQLNYKINCFTYRWDQHRHAAVSFIHDTLPDDSAITHWHRTDDVLLKFPLNTSKHFEAYSKGCKSLMDLLPITRTDAETELVSMQDFVNPSKGTINNIAGSDNIEEAYESSFVTLACETNYEYPWGQISEKTLDPIKQGSPILLLAGPHSLDLLKHWGLKTFHEFWDEGYDEELDPIKRMDKVFDIIIDISNQSYKELTIIRKHMKPILVHNRNLIRTGAIRKHITKVLA